MPQSRKRHGHHEHQHPADIPAAQRTKGRIIWALLLGVFGLIIAWSASNNYIAIIIGALAGAAIGYFIGKRMEQNA